MGVAMFQKNRQHLAVGHSLLTFEYFLKTHYFVISEVDLTGRI